MYKIYATSLVCIRMGWDDNGMEEKGESILEGQEGSHERGNIIVWAYPRRW
jgi:hypothetical protein